MLVHMQFSVKTTLRLGTVSVCLHGRRDIAILLLTASVAIWISVKLYQSHLKLETEDHLNLKYGVFRF